MALDRVTLDGRFVRLEPLEERHRELVRPAAQHPEIFTVTTSALGPLFDPYIDNALEAQRRRARARLRRLAQGRGPPVGMTRYLNIEEAHRKLEIGSTWYEPSVWGGRGQSGMQAAADAACLRDAGFNRVEYKTDVRNARSRAAILKLGAKQEGILRKHMIMADGHVRDSVYFSMIDEEWPGGEGRAGEAARGMSRYLASRLVEIVVTLALMSFVVYLLIGLMPGDPIDMMIAGDPKMTSEDAARLRAVYGIDKPLLERYLAWAGQALQGNFGYSRSFNQPVLAVLGPRLLNTLHAGGHRLPAVDRHRPAARRLGRRPSAQPRRLPGQPVLLRRHLRRRRSGWRCC